MKTSESSSKSLVIYAIPPGYLGVSYKNILSKTARILSSEKTEEFTQRRVNHHMFV